MPPFIERQKSFHEQAQQLGMTDSEYYEYLKSQQPSLQPIEIQGRDKKSNPPIYNHWFQVNKSLFPNEK